MTHQSVLKRALRLMLKEEILKRVLINRQKAAIAIMKKQLELLETRKFIRESKLVK